MFLKTETEQTLKCDGLYLNYCPHTVLITLSLWLFMIYCPCYQPCLLMYVVHREQWKPGFEFLLCLHTRNLLKLMAMLNLISYLHLFPLIRSVVPAYSEEIWLFGSPTYPNPHCSQCSVFFWISPKKDPELLFYPCAVLQSTSWKMHFVSDTM